MHAWVSAFAGRQALRASTIQPPPYLAQDWAAEKRERFPAWLQKCRVDAVICSEPGPIELLARAGYRIPGQIGLAHLAVECAGMPCAGIDQNSELVGAAAVDVVVGQLHRNERGIATPSRAVMVEGRWLDGPTVHPHAPSTRA
jgi:LacI family transcriptional regulator